MDNFSKMNLTLNESQVELLVTFDDIMTSEIVFFDASFEKDCIQFCKERNITFIPSLEFFDRCYELTDDKFQEEKIEDSQKVNIDENVFDKSVLEKFEKHHVLFVYRDDELEGVVHFCDYNRSPIFIYIYSLLLKFEKELRTLFTYRGLSNKDMIEFFGNRQNTEHYRKQFEKFSIPNNEIIMKELEPFQMFNLSDLIGLANSKDIIQISKSVIDIRNTIMHAKNPVKHEGYENAGLIYNYESFKEFFKYVKSLQLELRKVTNKINYVRV